jgi:hypothetical protein
MAQDLTLVEILGSRHDWPGSALVPKHAVFDGDTVDLRKTIDRMVSSRAYYQRQLAEAFAFKTRYGADYSDFTDRFDDNARTVRELDLAISYLEELAEEAAC